MNDVNHAIIDTAQILTTEIYTDMAKPSAQILGETAGRTAKMLLAPLRGMLWSWETIEKWLYDVVNKRIENIPNENRQSPQPEIAVPLIEAMRYSAHNENFREMYTKLLTNSMDNRKNKKIHPSYVNIIKQMDTLDAILFSKLCQYNGYIMAINPHIGGGIYLKDKYYPNALPEWYIGIKIDGYDMFDISASLLRLARLGLIDLIFNQLLSQENDDLVLNSEIQNKLSTYKIEMNDYSLEIIKKDSVINVNDFGKMFAQICLYT